MIVALLATDGPRFDGIRGVALVLLALPIAFLLLVKHLARMFPDPEGQGESSHGRDYYIGYTIGREAFRSEDVEDLVRRMNRESLLVKLETDDGGEKVFVARHLPVGRKTGHELEAGLLSGGLYRATRTRFEVEEERCTTRGDGYCRFVAIRG